MTVRMRHVATERATVLAALRRRVGQRDFSSAREVLGWVLPGAIAYPIVVAIHEGVHAIATIALGFGRATIWLGEGTRNDALAPVLAALDAGAGPFGAAAVAPGGALWRALLPTWAAVVVSVALWAIAVVVLWRAAARRGPGDGEGRGGLTTSLAVGVVAMTATRFVSFGVDLLWAWAGGRAPTRGDETRMAAATADPAVTLVLLLATGTAIVVASAGAVRRASSPESDARMLAFFLLVGWVAGKCATALVPPFSVG